MLKFIKQIFTWWNGQTISTRLSTSLFGKRVGIDEFGNQYYTTKSKNNNKPTRRWVIYNGYADSSKVPPKWHSWLHNVVNELPDENLTSNKTWIKTHTPNLTGSQSAYKRRGSLKKNIAERDNQRDYQSWNPAE